MRVKRRQIPKIRRRLYLRKVRVTQTLARMTLGYADEAIDYMREGRLTIGQFINREWPMGDR